ncbi:MAG: hypothetical protein J6T44_05310 [Prevotella sp.]|jgi:hypothetical protein|nr:hypothetical protein [Prevotella sp.]MBO7538681.1 hypothetical protein [Prevotella sp.]
MNQEEKLANIELPDYTTESDMKLEVGVTYQGSFKLSRNGMIVVKPYQMGSKPNNLKKVVDGDRHAIYLSKRLVRIVISLQKTDLVSVRQAYKDVIVDCYKDLCDLAL